MPKGDCFPKAVEVLRSMVDAGVDSEQVYLVHGRPVYQGEGEPDAGDGRFHHAWVEVDDGGAVSVHDLSNDRELVMARDAYYAVGRITPEVHTIEYDYWSAVAMMADFGHYGPWDGSVPPVA